MCRPDWLKVWRYREKHRKATTRDWDDGTAKRMSQGHPPNAQYCPYTYGANEAVEELELRCVAEGEIIYRSDKKFTFYLNAHHTVGVCSGFETTYVFAEWLFFGCIHGRPISEMALRKMGVRL